MPWDEITADVIKNCFWKAACVEGDDCVVEESIEGFQDLEGFPRRATIDDEVTTH